MCCCCAFGRPCQLCQHSLAALSLTHAGSGSTSLEISACEMGLTPSQKILELSQPPTAASVSTLGAPKLLQFSFMKKARQVAHNVTDWARGRHGKTRTVSLQLNRAAITEPPIAELGCYALHFEVPQGK